MKLAALFAAAMLLFAAYLAALYFSMVLWQGLVASTLLFLVVLICTGTGRIALRAAGISEISESERTLIGCTLGIGLLTQGMFLLGILGLLRVWAALLLLCGFWVVGFTEMRDVLKSLTANRNLLRDHPGWTAGILAFLALSLWTSWVPPHQYDSLVYHLALPATYVHAGKIIPAEYLIYSHFPQNGEMLFTLSLLLGSDILAQMFSWLTLVLSVLWIFEMGKREMPLTAALLACALLVSHTSVMLLSATAYVEVLAMLWVTASVVSFCRWNEVAESAGGHGWLVLSAVFAGWGVGTKYYVGVCPAILEVVIFLREANKMFGRNRIKNLSKNPSPLRGEGGGEGANVRRFPLTLILSHRGRGDSFRIGFKTTAERMFSFFIVAFLCASPWLIKNWIVVGNPVFPFLYDVLPHRGVAWGAENAQRYFAMLTEYGHGGHFWADLWKFPYMALRGDLKFGGGMDALGNLGWGAFFALIPSALWAARKNTTLRLILAYCFLHGCVWFCTGVVLRYLTVIAALMCLPMAAGLHQCWALLETRGKSVLAAAVVIFIATNLGLFLYVHTLLSSWRPLLGLDSREEFLSRKLDYYPCASYAREHLDKNDKILIVGEQRGYYVTQDHVASTPMAPNRFVAWANEASNPDDFARKLKSDGGFTHLLVVPREAQRLGPYGIFSFNDLGAQNWKGLEDGRVKAVYASNLCALLKIL